MAITIIRKVKGDEPYIMMFRTIQELVETERWEGGARPVTIGTVNLVDEKLKALSDAVKVEITTSEEEYHTELRRLAAERGQLITSHSTNPEWNPGEYIKHMEDGSN